MVKFYGNNRHGLLGNRNTYASFYAYNAMLSENLNNLQQILDRLFDTIKSMDLKVNVSNTKVANRKLYISCEKVKEISELISIGRIFITDRKVDCKVYTCG